MAHKKTASLVRADRLDVFFNAWQTQYNKLTQMRLLFATTKAQGVRS